MTYKVTECFIECGLVTVPLYHGRLQIVRDNGIGNPSEVMQGILTRADEVFFLLAVTGLYIG